MSDSNRKQTELPIDAIQIGKRRPADPEKVQWLARSILETGLLQPIGVTPDMRLVWGLHRLEACKALGWERIPAVIHDLDDLHAELAEIDENLMRTDLGAIELGEALVRRKEIYEQLYPETRHGGDRKSKAAKSSGNNCHLIAFAEDTAQKMGKSARTVRQYMKAAERIPHDLRKQLRNTDVGKKITELDRLGTLPEADQRAVVEGIAGGAESVVTAIKAIHGPRSPEMEKIIGAEQVKRGNGAPEGQSGEGAAPRCDTDDKAPADEQFKNAPSEELRATVDATAEYSAGPATSTEVETELPAVACASDDRAVEAIEAGDVDPVTVYRNFLRELPERVNFLYEHFDAVVGNGLPPNEAAAVLRNAIRFLEAAFEVESALAGQPAEMDCPLQRVTTDIVHHTEVINHAA